MGYVPLITHGEMYVYDNVTATVIEVTDTYHPIKVLGAGVLHGFTFDAGSSGAIADVATHAAGAKIKVHDVAHGLLNGEVVVFVGSTNYDGVYLVEEKEDDYFVVSKAWVADEAFNWYQPSTLKAGAHSGGPYLLTFNCSCDATSNGKAFKIEANVNTTPADNVAGINLFSNGTDYQQITASGILTISAGDYVWLSTKNLTDATDIIFYIINCNLVRL